MHMEDQFVLFLDINVCQLLSHMPCSRFGVYS